MKRGCLEVINDRRSILNFADKDVPKEVLDDILKAALRAPAPGGTLTGGYRGAHPISIIVVRDARRRGQLNEMLCEGRKMCIEEAPVSLVLCVDTHRMNRWAALGGGIPHFSGLGILWVSLRAVYTAAQNAVIAAESLGLGTQYIQEILWQPYSTLEFFELPKQVLPVAMIILGYPVDRPPLAPTVPLEAVVHNETYKDPGDDQLVAYFADKESYFQEWLRSLPADSRARKRIEARGVKTLAQYVSLLTYTESFYKWRDDVVRSNIVLSELD
jgi:nitroreductase